MVGAVKYGVRDMQTVPFTEALVIGEIPQTEEDQAFAERELENGVEIGIFEEVRKGEVGNMMGE